MEWPKELVSLFEDPLLDGVRPPAQRINANDRLLKELLRIEEWVENNGRKPSATGSLDERMIYRSLSAIKEKSKNELHDVLAQYDAKHLLEDS